MAKKSSPAPRRKTARVATKRSRGRPSAARGVVGRHAIIVAARQLVEKQAPHEVTMALIARKAGVDPALVRYYFPDRELLMFAVVENILADWAYRPDPDSSAADQISLHLANMLEFSCRVRPIQRLMEECASAKSPEVRNRVRELNSHVVELLSRMLRQDGGPARSPDALFLHVAIIGLCEFFAASQAMMQPLLPKGMTAEELGTRYADFIQELLLDGIRSRLRGATARH